MGRNTEHFRKKRVFIFGSLLLDAWSLRNCVDFLLILSLFILLMCVVGPVFLSRVSRTLGTCANQWSINHVCSVVLEHLRTKKLVFLGATWPVWTLNLAGVRNVQAVGKLGVMKSRISLNKSEVMGETVLRKPGSPSVVKQKRETKAGNGSCRVAKDGVAGTVYRFDA